MKKERPILMCGEMVRATLDGRKTQSRRVVKPQPVFTAASRDSFEWYGGKTLQDAGYGAPYVHSNWTAIERAMIKVCPHGKPGDRLWVRETFLLRGCGKLAVYRADIDPIEAAGIQGMYGGWKPSIFMPRWASRITLEIVSVRVERLQEITEEDAKAEGVDEEKYAVHYYCDEGDPDDPEDFGVHRCNWRFGFKMLWDSLNAKSHPWASNPWVWVIEFNKLNRI